MTESPADDLNDVDMNNAVWCIFMNVTLQAAVHLGREKKKRIRFTKNQLPKSVKQLIQMTEKLIMDLTEIVDYKEPPWISTTPQSDIAIEIKNAKTYVVDNWQIVISKIWIEYLECQWISSGKHSQDALHWAFSKIFKNLWLNHTQCETEQFERGFIFVSMYNDLMWRERGNTQTCETNSATVADYARRSPLGHRSFFGTWIREEMTRDILINQTENGDKTAERMMLNFAESCHPIFRARSVLERGDLRSKKRVRNLFTSSKVNRPLNWFFAR